MKRRVQVAMHDENIIQAVVNELCRPESYQVVYHRPTLEGVMPSLEVLTEVVERLRMVLFPAYFSDSEVTPATMPYITGSHLERVERLLAEQIRRGFGFSCEKTDRASCIECEDRSKALSRRFIATVPEIRRMLATDVMAARAHGWFRLAVSGSTEQECLERVRKVVASYRNRRVSIEHPRGQYALLREFIPATRCDAELGPGVVFTVPHHGVQELGPAIRAEIEVIIGCALRVDELPD